MLMFLDICEICPMVQGIITHNLLTFKMALKEWLEQFYRLDKKKLKMCWKVGLELSKNDNINSLQIHTLPNFLSMSEKNSELDSYNLLTSKNSLKSSKQLKIIFLFMSVLNTLQYKQRLCILTLPKCNT